MRGVTYNALTKSLVVKISTHTPHARRDLMSRKSSASSIFQLTRLLRGVTLSFFNLSLIIGGISTHTPLARRDINNIFSFSLAMLISTHTPLARRDQICRIICFVNFGFQLTRLLRGVTRSRASKKARRNIFQLTRLLRGVTFCAARYILITYISTHTPLARRDIIT